MKNQKISRKGFKKKPKGSKWKPKGTKMEPKCTKSEPPAAKTEPAQLQAPTPPEGSKKNAPRRGAKVTPIEGGSDICNVRESNPGLYRGRVVFYH